MGALGLRVGCQVRHDTDVLPGIEKTDTLTTIGLLYETKWRGCDPATDPAAPTLGAAGFGLESRIHDFPGVRP